MSGKPRVPVQVLNWKSLQRQELCLVTPDCDGLVLGSLWPGWVTVCTDGDKGVVSVPFLFPGTTPALLLPITGDRSAVVPLPSPSHYHPAQEMGELCHCLGATALLSFFQDSHQGRFSACVVSWTEEHS